MKLNLGFSEYNYQSLNTCSYLPFWALKLRLELNLPNNAY